MKYTKILFILVAFHLIIEVSSIVNFKVYKSKEKELSTNTYNDFLDIEVICQYSGALKNFVIRTNSTHVWFDYDCYSSLTEANEYDESILKGLSSSDSLTFKYESTDSLQSLSKINFICPVDYALNGFKFSKDSNQYLVVDYKCVGVKSFYQSPTNEVSTDSSEGPSNTLAALIGITCGDNTIETDEIPGTPLKGFKFQITSSSNNVKIQYVYSYYKLRSIELEKKEWAAKTKELRDSNTQKN